MTSPTVTGFHLSPQQRHLWHLGAARHPLLVQAVYRLPAGSRGAELRRRAEALVARHEILRTRFVTPSGMKVPLQVVDEPRLSWLESEAEDDAAVARHADDERSAGFDLESGPLVRFRLLLRGGAPHRLLVTASALCADLESLRLVGGELATPGSDEEAVQYADVAEVFSELLDSEEGAAGREYWQADRWRGRSPSRPSQLREDGRNARFEPRRVAVPLADGAVESLAQSLAVAPETALLAAWCALAGRICDGDDLLLGVSFQSRGFAGLEAALGPYARLLPVGVENVADLDLRGLAQRLEEALAERREWQELYRPGDERRGDEDGGFPVTFAALPAADGGLPVESCAARQSRFALQLTAVQGGGGAAEGGAGWNLWLEHDAARLPAAAARPLAAALARLVAQGREPSAHPVRRLSLLDDEARRRLLSLHDRGGDGGAAADVVDLFARRAAEHPERPALADGDGHLPYRELDLRSGRLARRLRELGVGPERPVALLLERSPAFVVGLLGVLKAAGVYVPLDPEHPEDRLEQQLAQLGGAPVVVQAATRDRLPAGWSGERVDLDDGVTLASGEALAPAAVEPDNLAYLIFTSGSTGRPKPVAVSRGSLAAYTDWACRELLGFDPAEAPALSYAMVSTVGADLGNTVLFPSLVSGGRLTVVPYALAASPQAMAQHARRHPVDVLKIVPTHLKALTAEAETARELLPRHRLILGGESLPAELFRTLGELAPDCGVVNHYGPTETTVGVAACHLDAGMEAVAGSLPIGGAAARTRLYVVDPLGEPVLEGMPGELRVGGAGLARGYAGRPAETAARFVPDPYSGRTGERLYRTGDLVRCGAGGRLHFLGRVDRQVKVRGHRVEPAEVERVLGGLQGVSQAVVTAIESQSGDPRLAAYVVPAAGASVDPETLRSELARHLPDPMIPSWFVELGALPLTRNGKVDRSALPAPEAGRGGRPYEAPRNAAETALAEIWAEVLGVERVGVEDDFFALGGDSILSIQIVARAKRRGLGLNPTDLFRHPTIAELAPHLATAEAGEETTEDGFEVELDEASLRGVMAHFDGDGGG